MSEEKDGYTFDDTEFKETEDSTFKSEEFTPVEESNNVMDSPIDPEAEDKKKRRRTILIIIFAIVLPVILGLVGLGFLIWGLVVGFTNCANSCGNCCDECFSCCDNCNACGESCNSCSNSCSNCGSSCDSCNCCGSSSSINEKSVTLANTKCSFTFRENLQVTKSLLKWHFYRLVEFVEWLFLK